MGLHLLLLLILYIGSIEPNQPYVFCQLHPNHPTCFYRGQQQMEEPCKGPLCWRNEEKIIPMSDPLNNPIMPMLQQNQPQINGEGNIEEQPKQRLRLIPPNIKPQISIISVPFDKGQKKYGVAKGPIRIKEVGIIKDLEALNFNVINHGDIKYVVNRQGERIEGLNNLTAFTACAQEVSRKVREALQVSKPCLILGGDHSIAAGSIDGHIKAAGEDNVAVLWLDAHADINTHKTSSTGNIHGMPVALLARQLKNQWKNIDSLSWMSHGLSLKNLAYIGLRSVDTAESLVLDRYGVTRYTSEDVLRMGVHNVVENALRSIDPNNNKSIHVSLDIDSLDVLEAPSTGTSVRGGLTLRELLFILEEVHSTGRLTALDVVEVNPYIGDKNDAKKTIDAARYAILSAFGYSRRGYNPNGVLY